MFVVAFRPYMPHFVVDLARCSSCGGDSPKWIPRQNLIGLELGDIDDDRIRLEILLVD